MPGGDEGSHAAVNRIKSQGFKGNSPKERSTNAAKGKHRLFYEGEGRRKEVLERIASGELVKDAVQAVGVSYGTYEKWRHRFGDWAAQVDAARIGTRDPTPDQDGIPVRLHTTFDIAEERKRWFGHNTPSFQMEMLEARRTAAPGSITLVLLPPEHGKTTCYEDDVTLDIAYNPWRLHHVASETQHLAAKILNKIRNRLDPGPGNKRMVEFVNRFGPFAPQKGERKTTQPWASTKFDVWRKGDFDDRDFTMAALGFGSQVIGSRSHDLHLDDGQSLRTLSQTEKFVNEFRQDWLSRPGETGATSIYGNRVDAGDIYEAFEEVFDPDILRVIRYPAILSDGTPLWSERWTLEKLDRMRRKVGEERWERNWMQRPRPKSFMAFKPEVIEGCFRKDLSLVKPNVDDGRVAYLCLDPAIGGRTAIVLVQVTATNKLRVAYVRDIPGLRSNEEIMGHCRLALEWAVLQHGFDVTHFIIEAKNFQAGLARDERLLEMSRRFGCDVVEHLTGMNKYDENVGVASMVTTFVKQEIELPYADDGETQALIGQLKSQLEHWKPGPGGGGSSSNRGNKLRQDLVMALHWGWIRWRSMGKADAGRADASQFNFGGLPYAPHDSGLIVPTSYTPTMIGAA